MERTNVTDKGFTFNGQNFSKESRVDSQGQSYSVDTPNTISAQSLMGGQQAPIVPVAPNFNVDTSTTPRVTSYLQSASDVAQANVDTQNEEALKTGNNIASLQEMLGGRASDTQSAMKVTGATDIAAQLRNLNAQSIALGQDSLAKTLAEQNKATGQNITSTAVQRNVGDATRENTINVAKIGIQAAIAQADYATARDLAETIVSAKYDRITAQIEAGRTNLALLEKYKLTPLEEKAKKAQESLFKKQESDALQARQQETRAYNEQIDNKKEISKMMVEASQNAPADVLARAKAVADDGGSAMAVAQALGQFGGDYMGNLVKLASIEVSNSTVRKNNKEYDKAVAEIKNTQSPVTNSSPQGSNAWSTNNWVNSAVHKGSLVAEERASISKAFAIVGQLGALQANLSKDQTSFFGGNVKKIMANLGQNADAGVIQAQITALVPQVAKGVYGEVGVLTDQDTARYTKTLGNLTSPEAQNKAVTALTLTALRNGVKSKLDIASASKQDVSGFVPLYQNLTNQINAINNDTGVNKDMVVEYGRKNPQVQKLIQDLSAQGKKDSEILQVLGVEN